MRDGENYLENHFLLMDNTMDTSNKKMENLINECKLIEEDSMYNAETHYLIAAKLTKRAFWFKFIPVIITGISALALLLGSPSWVSWITLTFSIISIANIFLEPESKAREHELAAKNFTVLKHDARSLYESFKDFIDEKDFYYEVKRIREKYNWLVQTTPPTDEKSFEKARERIKKEIHKPDFKKG